MISAKLQVKNLDQSCIRLNNLFSLSAIFLTFSGLTTTLIREKERYGGLISIQAKGLPAEDKFCELEIKTHLVKHVSQLRLILLIGNRFCRENALWRQQNRPTGKNKAADVFKLSI